MDGGERRGRMVGKTKVKAGEGERAVIMEGASEGRVILWCVLYGVQYCKLEVKRKVVGVKQMNTGRSMVVYAELTIEMRQLMSSLDTLDLYTFFTWYCAR